MRPLPGLENERDEFETRPDEVTTPPAAIPLWSNNTNWGNSGP